MDVLTLAVTLSGVGACFYGLIRVSQAAEAKLDTAWGEAARKVDGTFKPAEGSWYARTPRRIEATLDRIDVVADSYVVRHGKGSTAYTRLTVTAVPNSRGFSLSIDAENVFASIGKALGAQDVVVGEPRFDEAFVVKSNAEDMARAWLHGEVTEGLCPLTDFCFELENGTLRATLRGLLDDGPKLARALRAVAKLAARGRELEGEWAEAASRTGGIVRQSLNFARADLGSFTLSRKGIEVVVAVEREEEAGLVTTLTAPVALGRALDDEAQAKLFEAAGDLPVARFQFGEASSVLALRGIQRDGEALDRLLEAFVELLGERSVGPYR